MLNIHGPIQVFSVLDFGIDLQDFYKETRPIFYNLPLDFYDAKKEQIVFFDNNLSKDFLQGYQARLFDFYRDATKNSENCETVQSLYDLLSDNQKMQFNKIKPFRRRAVSNFIVWQEGSNTNFKRISTPPFSQIDAYIKDEGFDFRKLPRIFTEIDDKFVNTEIFKGVLEGVANKIIHLHPTITSLGITVHHVLVETSSERVTSNSPEGIHQDGYDYIVSALVVERSNVSGGVSEIFGDDKSTKILTTTLESGYGILQPDKNTSLWHHVTKLLVKSPENPGYRSSIGFDIELRYT